MTVMVEGKKQAVSVARDLAQTWQPAYILKSEYGMVFAVTTSISECSRLGVFGYVVTKMVAKS